MSTYQKGRMISIKCSLGTRKYDFIFKTHKDAQRTIKEMREYAKKKHLTFKIIKREKLQSWHTGL